MRIAVCDGVPFYREALAECIRAWAALNGARVQVEKYESGEAVLFGIEQTGDFAAVFVGIELSGMDGIKTAVKVKEQQSRLVSIVFVTEHEKYFGRMFGITPSHHVPKPISRQKVFETLDKIVVEQRIFFESFAVKYNRKTTSIPLGEVFYFESEKRLIRSFLERDREYVFYQRMNMLEEELTACNHYFIRTHQSYLINLRQVEQFCISRLKMRNGDDIPVTRERRQYVEQVCNKFLSSEKLHESMLFVT